MFLIAVALIVLGAIAQLPVSSATPESLEDRIAKKKMELPGCSPELLKWLVETDQIVQAAVQKEQLSGILFGGAGKITLIDLYCDAAGKWQKLGGPYFRNVEDSAETRKAIDDVLQRCLAQITPPPSWFHDSVRVEIMGGYAGVYVDTCYFDVEKLNRAWVSHSDKMYPPQDDPSTDQWLAKLEADISRNPSPSYGSSCKGLIPPGSSLKLAFFVSKEGYLKFVRLDQTKSVEANQAVLQLLIDRLPLMHRPRNISSQAYLLEVSNEDDKLEIKCARAGRIVAGRIGQTPPYFDDCESFGIRFHTGP